MFSILYRVKSLLVILTAVLLCISSCSYMPETKNDKQTTGQITSQKVPVYTYQIVNKYPHDRDAFTQGLVFEDGIIYEGTGLYGKSSLRKVELETGNVLQLYELPDQYFGEGITVLHNIIIQLTWKSNLGFYYDKESLNISGNFTYVTEGWGITNDGDRLIMSDGTSTLHFLDPDTFNITGHIEVYNNDISIDKLNELEYINGRIYANIWQTDNIVIINPYNGQVNGWIDLSGLIQSQDYSISTDVLNGIAYDNLNNRLFVTGKLWPWLFEIELVIKE